MLFLFQYPFFLSIYISTLLSIFIPICHSFVKTCGLFFLVFSLRPCHFEFIALISNKILWQGRRVKMILHKKKICFAHFAKSVFACLHPTIKGMFGKILVHQFSCIFYSISESLRTFITLPQFYILPLILRPSHQQDGLHLQVFRTY